MSNVPTPPATDSGWQTPPGDPGNWGTPAPPSGQGGWGAPASPSPAPAYPPMAGGPPSPYAKPSRNGVPVWAFVICCLLALVIGLAIGGVGGYTAGVGSSFLDAIGDPFAAPGADAAVGTASIDANRVEVGSFVVTDLAIYADFADDFAAELVLTNHGPDWAGGAVEVIFFRGQERVGRVANAVQSVPSGQAVRLDLFGFDDYDPSADRLEIRIG